MKKSNIAGVIVIGIALAIVAVLVGGFPWGWRAAAPTLTTMPGNTQGGVAGNGAAGTSGQATSTPRIAKGVFVPHGAVTYQVAEAATQLPGFTQATIDPADVAVGQAQHFVIVTSDPNPVVSVTAYIGTDHATTTVPLQSQGTPPLSMLVPRTLAVGADGTLAVVAPQKPGTAVASDGGAHGAVAYASTTTLTEWSGQWIVKDTHTANYSTTFVAKDSAGNTNSITLQWSDPTLCPFVSVNNYSGGTATVSSNCTLGSPGPTTDGVENGTLSVTGGTLTLSSGETMTINNGYSVLLQGGSILVPSNGQILLGYEMCGTDSDGDSYIAASSWTATAGTSCGSMAARRNLANPSGGNIASVGDCDDNDARAYPNETSYYTTQMNSGYTTASAWDFDCSGSVSYQYSGSGSLTSTGNCSGPYSCSSPQGTLGIVGTVGCGGTTQQVVDQGNIAHCMNNGQPTGQTCDIWTEVSGSAQGCK